MIPLSIGVLIVDDHAEFRRAARALLNAAGFEVVGEAGTGHEALATAARCSPSAVLLDVQLPDIDGFAITESLLDRAELPLVILTSSRSAGAYRRRLAASRAAAFIAKRDLSAQSLAAVLRWSGPC
jgi:two-component system nitrate/nitrite response regulator NarL